MTHLFEHERVISRKKYLETKNWFSKAFWYGRRIVIDYFFAPLDFACGTPHLQVEELENDNFQNILSISGFAKL